MSRQTDRERGLACRPLNRTVLSLGICLAFLAAPHLCSGDEHGEHGELFCSDCHTMHYSERGEIPPGSQPGGPFEKLLLTATEDQLCLNCHDGGNPDAPNVENETGYEPAAGRFSWSGLVNEDYRHSLGSSATPPGFTGGSWTEVLTCGSCHEPHGNASYRYLVEDPGGLRTVKVPRSLGPVDDGRSAVQEVTGEPRSARYSTGNIRYRRSSGGPEEHGLAEWCGGCHGEFHGPGGDPKMGGSPRGDTGPGREWVRHPTRDVTMADAVRNLGSGAEPWFMPLASRVPVVSAKEIPGSPADSDNEVFCGSCHRAHGSNFPDLLIGDLAGSPAFGDGARPAETCTQCHFGPLYLQSPHGDTEHGVERVVTRPSSIGECTQCHTLHASLEGEPVSGGPFTYGLYMENTDGLCFDPSSPYGCHKDTPFGYPAQETDRLPEGTEQAGYFEANSGGVRIAGLRNRRRWPGMIAYTDRRTYTLGRFFSPHRNDTDMPIRDEEGRGLCLNCHDPHGTEGAFDMLTAGYRGIGGSEELGPPANYRLCFACHGPEGPVGMDEASRKIADFYDNRIVPDNRGGHQIRLSQKSALSWPGHVRRGDKLPCYDCHNPHGSLGNDGVRPNGFLVSDQRQGWSGLTDTLNDPEQVRAFCFGCHIPADGIPGSQSVEGIVMNTIPDLRGHRSLDRSHCYDCHGRDYSSPNSYNVHHPGPGGPIRGGGSVRETW